MEDMVIDPEFWQGRRVFITGQTGFKGGWFALWLKKLGAIVSGFSLEPPTVLNFYTATGLDGDVPTTIADVGDLAPLASAMKRENPEIAFHFAAQPLVRDSYENPVDTFHTNVMGTVHFLEAVRHTSSVRSAVVVTSDKCYENHNSTAAHLESDPMGGANPYAGSKACAELVIDAYRRSYFSDDKVSVASVRAGNVIGGGDWGADRLIPDMVGAFEQGRALSIRYPNAVRPWQYVLDPLAGYLGLAEKLYPHGKDYAKGWNFGPNNERSWKVMDIVRESAKLWGGDVKWEVLSEDQPHEDGQLSIDSSMAYHHLGWKTKLDVQMTLKWTIEWYRAFWDGNVDMRRFTFDQIDKYESLNQSSRS